VDEFKKSLELFGSPTLLLQKQRAAGAQMQGAEYASPRIVT
jgi:hypothetical protein